MGVVQRESIKSTIISYIGAGLGFFNQMILFTSFLTTDEIGLANVIILIAISYSQFSGLGASTVILRFFPFFRDKKAGHNGLLFGILSLVTVGFLMVSLIFWGFHAEIVGFFSKNAPLLTSYINFVVPLAYCWILLEVFDSYLRSLYKTVISTLVRDVFKRIGVMISVGLYALEWLTFEKFVLIYIVLHCALPLVLIGYAFYLGQLKLRPNFGRVWQQMYKQVLTYGMFSLLAYSAAQLIGYIDSIMLSGMIGESEAGVYTISLFATSLIVIPGRALIKVTSAQVADFWQKKDFGRLGETYKQTSVLSLVVATYCFLGIWINRDNMFAIIGEEFREGAWVLLFTGLGRVVSMWIGFSAYILNLSKKYIYGFWINVFVIVFGVILNYFLIKTYGIKGAAMATLFTLAIANLIRISLVWQFFKLHPFTWAMPKCLAIACGAYLLTELIPVMPHYLIDIPVRSGIFSILFIGVLVGLKVSPDINDFITKMLKRFF